MSDFHTTGNVPAIVDDIRLKLKAIYERIVAELPPHISLHNAKQAIEDAGAALANHPSQRKGNERSHPNLADQTDEKNLKAAAHPLGDIPEAPEPKPDNEPPSQA